MTRAGELNRRIHVERATTAKNSHGERVETWSPLGSPCWAKRTDASDGEQFAAGEMQAFRRVRFIVRSSDLTRSITAKDRIVHGGKVHQILGVKETKDGLNRFIEITASVRND